MLHPPDGLVFVRSFPVCASHFVISFWKVLRARPAMRQLNILLGVRVLHEWREYIQHTRGILTWKLDSVIRGDVFLFVYLFLLLGFFWICHWSVKQLSPSKRHRMSHPWGLSRTTQNLVPTRDLLWPPYMCTATSSTFVSHLKRKVLENKRTCSILKDKYPGLKRRQDGNRLPSSPVVSTAKKHMKVGFSHLFGKLLSLQSRLWQSNQEAKCPSNSCGPTNCFYIYLRSILMDIVVI